MGHWDAVQAKARAYRLTAFAAATGPEAEALLGAAERISGVTREPLRAGHTLLRGGEAVLDRDADTIWYNEDVEPWRVLFVQAHEYAHLWLSDSHGACSATDIDTTFADDNVATSTVRMAGYGPHERREREANTFAMEFLLPLDVLRGWYVTEGMDSAAIASRIGLPEWLVVPQLCRALLVPDVPVSPDHGEHESRHVPVLDPSQHVAAHAQSGPLLVEAGPGTGKTRTLVGRLAHLLLHGLPPENILALTFSNRAAEEMRQRVAHVAPTSALAIWMGTFHAFGLELLRKYGTRIGLPASPTVLDPIGAIFLLESMLPDLHLSHYQNLYQPTQNFRDLLNAVSRAKDELVTPAEYTALAQRMLEEAADPAAQIAGEKALEVAGVYTLYQARLERDGVLDFGDLLFRAVELLRLHPDIRALVRDTYSHILVDEYQDVNRASGLLLKEVAGDGTGLWVVGDTRQAIYRFRGAAPSNVRLFGQDFPDARLLALRRNYRSQPAIVELVSTMVPHMGAGRGLAFSPWEADRPDAGGRVQMEIADLEDTEGIGLAREIAQRRTEGVSYRDQAVLCRTHRGLTRIATALERAGIPVLYLGNLLEREEVRDLLALLQLANDGRGNALVRVARFPEYEVPLEDVRKMLAFARECGVPFPRVLERARDAGLTYQGTQGLLLLGRHLDGLCYGTSPWRLLSAYLFSRSAYLNPLLRDESVRGTQRRMALFQFLQFAREWRPREQDATPDPKRAFLRHVRQIRAFGEDRMLRQLPEWAESIDAVRLLTVHASKGLEFSAVYLPRLATSMFPMSAQQHRCPPPRGMLSGEEGDGAEEEECLFFVAVSRARDTLCLSRALRYGRQNHGPSSLLASVATVLPHPPGGIVTWHADASDLEPETAPSATPPHRPTFEVRMLDVYLDCPRQFYFEFELGLSGRHDDTAYVQFHRCVYAVLRWLQEERAAGRAVDAAAATAQLAEIWQSRGPHDHPYQEIYRREAERMVARALARTKGRYGKVVTRALEVELKHGRIRLEPDHVEINEDAAEPAVLVQRLRTGHATASEQKEDIYALYHRAIAEAYPGAKIDLQTLYLSTDHTQTVNLPAKTVATRLAHYDEAMRGILEGRYPARPDERRCPRCAHYFICSGDE